MLKRLILILVCLVAVYSVTAGSAAAQATDADTKAAAKELMKVMRVADQMKVIAPAIFQALKPAIVQGRAEVERDYEVIQRQVTDAFMADMDDFLEAMAAVYARHFTAAELRDLTNFMRGSTGQKFVGKVGVIMQEGMVVGQKFGERAALAIRDKMIEGLRKRGHNI